MQMLLMNIKGLLYFKHRIIMDVWVSEPELSDIHLFSCAKQNRDLQHKLSIVRMSRSSKVP